MSHVLSEIITVVNFDNVQLSPTLSSFGITELRRSLDHQSTSNSVQMSEIEGKKTPPNVLPLLLSGYTYIIILRKVSPYFFTFFKAAARR